MSIWDDPSGAAPGGVPPGLLAQLLQSGALSGLLGQQSSGGAPASGGGGGGWGDPVPNAPGMAPTSPIPFMGMLNQGGGFGPAAGAQAAVPDLPPSTNDPEAREPAVFKDGVPLPRPRPMAAGGIPAPVDNPATAYAADMSQAAASTPSAPAPFSMAPGAGPAPADGGGIGSILGKVFNPNHAATMIALGSGFAGAGSIGTGMRRAFSNAVPAIAADRAFEQKQLGQNATYAALIRKGVPVDEATAAVNNPDILKATIGKYFETKPRTFHTIKDALGGETPITLDDKGRAFDLAGKPITSADAGGAGGGAGSGSLLAPGVKFDQNLTGEDYFNQFSPDVKAAAKAYMNGDVMPTGNPRSKAIATYAKTVAQRYGQDLGIPVSDSLYAEKRKMMTDIASSGPTSIGGILSNGKSAFGHLANYSDKLVDLGSHNGPDIPGGGVIASGMNYVGGKMLPTADTKAKIAAANDNAMKYGQEATKFYSGTGGGVAERLAALHSNDPLTTTGKEQAAYLETEKQLMLERLNQKEAQVRGTLGQGYLDAHPVMSKDVQDHIEKIDTNIRRLRGEAVPSTPQSPGATPAAASNLPTVSTPADAAKLPKGTKFVDPNGVTRVVP